MEQTIWGFLLSLLVLSPFGVWLAIMLAQPKIVPSQNKSWKIEDKRVVNYDDDKPSSTDFIESNYVNYENHNFYLFTVKNKELRLLGLRRSKAEITSAKMSVYDKSKKIIKNDLSVRYTDKSSFYVHNPLFAGNFLPKDGSSNRNKVVLGDGQSLHIVFACNPIEKNKYYIFTEESDSFRYFPAEINRIEQSAPFYIKITISGDKFNEVIKLKVNEVGKGSLEAELTNEEL
jgi:hypothetical protein